MLDEISEGFILLRVNVARNKAELIMKEITKKIKLRREYSKYFDFTKEHKIAEWFPEDDASNRIISATGRIGLQLPPERAWKVVGHEPWNKASLEFIESLRRQYGIKPPDKPYEELSIDERYRLYRFALRIRSETGYGKIVIAKVLGISSTTVHSWLYRGSKPRLNYTPIDTTPSAELAYIVGAMLGDGNVQKIKSITMFD